MKIYRNRLKYTKMTKFKNTSKTRQKFDFRMKPKITTLLSTCFRSLQWFWIVAVAFRSEEEVLWRRGPPWPILAPPWIRPWADLAEKATTLVRDLEYFIHTKFHQNLSSGSGEEVENVNCLTADRRTDAGQRVITIGHWSLWLLCPKNIANQEFLILVDANHNMSQESMDRDASFH